MSPMGYFHIKVNQNINGIAFEERSLKRCFLLAHSDLASKKKSGLATGGTQISSLALVKF